MHMMLSTPAVQYTNVDQSFQMEVDITALSNRLQILIQRDGKAIEVSITPDFVVSTKPTTEAEINRLRGLPMVDRA